MTDYYRKLLLYLLFILFVVITVNLPSLVANVFTPQSMTFSGQNPWFDPWDINIYVSTIRWAQKHPFEYRNLYTTNHEPLPIVYPLYTLIGTLFSNFDPFIIYNALKFLTGTFLVGITFLVTKELIKNKKKAMIVTILTFFAGGFGWLVDPYYPAPDISMTPFTFLSTLNKPHESLAMGYYALSLFFLFRATNTSSYKEVTFSALALLPVLLFYPYYSISYLAIALLYSVYLLKTRQLSIQKVFKKYLFIGAITIPLLVLYSFYLLSTPDLKNVFSPYLEVPDPFFLLLGYGVLAPLVIVQLFNPKKSSLLVFLNIWFFSSIFLSYTNLSFARYFLRGLFYPAILIAFLSLPYLANLFKITHSKLNFLIVVTVPITSIAILATTTLFVIHKDQNWVYLSKEKVKLFEYLNTNSNPGEGVLVNDFNAANQIPAYTHNSVFYGHGYQTPDSKEKLTKLNSYYSREFNDQEALDFLIKNNILHVITYTEGETHDQSINYEFLTTTYSNERYVVKRFSTDHNMPGIDR